MKANPRLELPEDPDKSTWAYYSVFRITPIVKMIFIYYFPYR